MSPSLERAKRTVVAAEVLHSHLEDIATACAGALADEVVVAQVLPNGCFGGVEGIRRGTLHSYVCSLPEGSWPAVFRPLESIEAIEDRCIRMGYQAYRRAKLCARRTRRLEGE